MSEKGQNAARRPSLPPMFWAACCSWAGTLVAETASWSSFVSERGEGPPLQCMLIGIALAASATAATLRFCTGKRARTRDNERGVSYSIGAFCNSVLICMMSFTVSVLCASLFWSSWSADVRIIQQGLSSEQEVRIELTGDPVERGYGTVSTGRMSIGSHMCSIRFIWPDGSCPVFSGHSITATGSALTIEDNESGRWSHQNGYIATLKATSVADSGYAGSLRGYVAQLRDRAFAPISSLGSDGAGLLSGVLLGNRTLYQGTELEQAFRTTGLAHLMAVSGTHLAVVTMLISTFLSRTPLRRRPRSIVLLLFLVLYVALTAMSASALRACTMCAVALVLGMFKWRKHVINALALCVFCFLSLSPPIAFSLGFQLSVLAVLGLVLFGSLMRTWVEKIVPSRFEFISTSISATLAATLLTIPVTISQFAQMPIISPLANIIAAPLITLALSMGMVGTMIFLFLPSVGTLILHAAAAIASLCATLVRLIAGLPCACIPVSGNAGLLAIVFAALTIALWAIWPQPGRRTGAAAGRVSSYALAGALLAIPLLLVLMTSFGQSAHSLFSSDSRLVMLDVGQGDAILIQSHGANVLVDTGEKTEILSRELAEQGVAHLQAIVITHKDSDHCGALKALSGVLQIDHVYVHEDLLEEDAAHDLLDAAKWATKGRGAEGLAVGSKLTIGEFMLTIVSPEHGGQSSNAESLVGLLEFDADNDGSIESRGLLTGDAESETIQGIFGGIGDIDFLKVAHHGSKGGLTDEQLSVLSPEIALISVGAENTYGHPTMSTLKQLEKAGARTYRTDEQGAITLDFSGHEIAVSSER